MSGTRCISATASSFPPSESSARVKRSNLNLLDRFEQQALDGYLPAIVSEFEENRVRYEVTYLSVPTAPQAVDLI